MSGKILELAYLRNQLASKKFSEDDSRLLQVIEEQIKSKDSIFKEIALNAIMNSKLDIKNGDFESAAQEIQLIHNFTFEKPELWNSNYFYTIELLSYLEQVKNAERIKKTICLIGWLESKI